MGVIDEEIDKLKQKSDGLLIQIRAAYEQRRTTLNSADVVKLDVSVHPLTPAMARGPIPDADG